MDYITAKAYSEVSTILSYMDKEYIDKIPIELLELFENEKLVGYEPKIQPETDLNEYKLQRKTLIILTILNLNYWCESDEERNRLLKIYSDNNKKRGEELREKYNPDNIFKNNNIDVKEELPAVVDNKETIFQKIISKIKKFLNK